MRRPTVLALSMATMLVLGAVVVPSTLTRAQDGPPVAPGPNERVLFAPLVGPPGITGVAPAAGRWPWSAAGLVLQNAGLVSTRFMVVYLAEAPGSDCPVCRQSIVQCSPPVAPGAAWTAPAFTADPTGGPQQLAADAVVYSLNNRPARDYGPEWVGYLATAGLKADASPADVACHALEPRSGGAMVAGSGRRVDALTAARGIPADVPCEPWRLWHDAFLHGSPAPFAPTLPMAPFIGEPVAGVVASPARIGSGSAAKEVVDRYAAVALADTGWGVVRPSDTTYGYLTPGAYLALPETPRSHLILQNAGADCVTARIEAYQNGHGLSEFTHSVTIGAGGRVDVDLTTGWPVPMAATMHVTADGPLAVVLVNRGAATSTVSPASRERVVPVAWALPLAYQEARQGPLRTMAPAGIRSDEGWGTYVAITNPVSPTRNVRLHTQTIGKPARDVDYPLKGESQTVFQLGFGLGLPGGPGWGRFSAGPPPIYVAAETLRSAADNPSAYIESWMTPAWAIESGAPGPRTVALPDLGGPALGPAGAGQLGAGRGITTALTAQVAVQSVVTSTARVAIDTYAACGFAGTVTQDIDPAQAVWLPASSLAGPATFGANQAIVRVLAGDVAVLTTITRPDRPTTVNYPADLTSAYLGAAFEHVLSAPRLTVTPTAVTITLAQDIHGAVRIAAVPTEAVCFGYVATADVPWLGASLARGPIPSDITLTVDLARLGPGNSHVGILTLTSDPPGAPGSPLTVQVTVIGQGRLQPLYLPWGYRPGR